jgi:hypothetical protein
MSGAKPSVAWHLRTSSLFVHLLECPVSRPLDLSKMQLEAPNPGDNDLHVDVE